MVIIAVTPGPVHRPPSGPSLSWASTDRCGALPQRHREMAFTAWAHDGTVLEGTLELECEQAQLDYPTGRAMPREALANRPSLLPSLFPALPALHMRRLSLPSPHVACVTSSATRLCV